MSLVKWIILGLLTLPVLEVAAFILVASIIGLFWAVLLMIATSVAGVLLLRSIGTASLAHARGEVNERGFQAIGLELSGLGAVAGALLLVIPGFISDVIGAALLIPAVRRGAAAAFRRARGNASGDPSVIDLDPADWRKEPDRAIPDRRDPPAR